MSGAERRIAQRQGAQLRTVLVEIDHPDGMVYAWTGDTPLDYGGNTYQGLGFLGAVSGIRTTTEITIVELRFTVSGVDPELVAGLSSSVKGRTGTVYEAYLSPDRVVTSVRQKAYGLLDFQTYRIGEDGMATIDVAANAGMFHLRRKSNARWAPETARSQFPAETGFDEMHLQKDAQDFWRAA